MRKTVLLLLAATFLVIPVSAHNDQSDISVNDRQKGDISEKAEKYSEWENKTKQIIEKWNSLSDKQRGTIYKMQVKIDRITAQMADKYFEYGILSQEEVEKYKEYLETRSQIIRDNDAMPGIKFGGKHQKPVLPESSSKQILESE